MANTKTKRMIIFDYDGVIAASLDTSVKVFNNLAKKYEAKPITKAKFRRFYKEGIMYTIKQMDVSIFKIPRLLLEAQKEMVKAQKDVVFVKGVKEAILKIAKNKNNELAIVTGNVLSVVKKNLAKNGLSKCFKKIKGVKRGKSKASAVKSIAKSAKAEQEECYFIVDTARDVEDAHQADVKAVGVSWGYQKISTIKKEKPHKTVSSPAALAKIFDK